MRERTEKPPILAEKIAGRGDTTQGGATMAFSYRCADYPGMEACPASFTAETEAELWKHIELHGATAHGENPEHWSPDDRQQIKKLIR
jgi:hypothetical protein